MVKLILFSCFRHRHALKRVRGEGGKFNSNDNKRSDSGDLSDGYDDSDQVKKKLCLTKRLMLFLYRSWENLLGIIRIGNLMN